MFPPSLRQTAGLLSFPLRRTSSATPMSAALTRFFSATPSAAKYKLKSHSGAKKRWKSIASGKFKRGQAGHVHLNVTKSAGRKNSLGTTAYSHGSQTSRLKKLLPWGS